MTNSDAFIFGGGVSKEIDFLSDIETIVKRFVIGKEYEGVFLKPKLNPEYDAVMLLGPGVNAVTKPNITRFSKSGYIF